MKLKTFNDSLQCIYIHIPKVAGISIETALFNDKVGHAWAQMYNNEDKVKFAKYFTFSFVRNPYDRLVSAYFFLKKGGRNIHDLQWSEKHLSSYSSFDQFVKSLEDRHVKDTLLKWTHFIPQYKFLCNQESEVIVDFVGRFETLETDFKYVCHVLNKDCTLPHRNKTDIRQPYQAFYSKELQDIVYSLYQKDFELFDYKYDIGN